MIGRPDFLLPEHHRQKLVQPQRGRLSILPGELSYLFSSYFSQSLRFALDSYETRMRKVCAEAYKASRTCFRLCSLNFIPQPVLLFFAQLVQLALLGGERGRRTCRTARRRDRRNGSSDRTRRHRSRSLVRILSNVQIPRG